MTTSIIVIECISCYHISNYNEGEITNTAKPGLKKLIIYYNTNPSDKYVMDNLQQNFRCCGCDSPYDWSSKSYPHSCYHNFKSQYNSYLYEFGCNAIVTQDMANKKANMWSFDVLLIILHFLFCLVFFGSYLSPNENREVVTDLVYGMQIIRNVVSRSSYQDIPV
jgi:hypothetical protein